MVAVFAIFGTLSFIDMKQMGVGLAAAILIDATIVRGGAAAGGDEAARRLELVPAARRSSGGCPSRGRARLGRHASCPGSIARARWNVKSPSPGSACASNGSSRSAQWSPAGIRSRIRPANQFGQSSRTGVPPGPACHAQRSNLSTSSPVSEPNSSASSLGVLGHEVDDEHVGVARDAERAVLVRQADEEPRRVDAALRREADEAARALGRRRSP